MRDDIIAANLLEIETEIVENLKLRRASAKNIQGDAIVDE